MRKEMQYQSVEVIYEKVNECPVKDRMLIFFQMVYIISGTGYLTMNGNRVSYHEGNLLLLTPNDSHTFEVSTTTEFLMIRFNKGYVNEYRWKSIDHIECLLYYATHLSGCVMRSKTDMAMVKTIVTSILQSFDSADLYNEDLTIHFINALIVIIARNISQIKPAHIKAGADKRILEIIDYIQNNIYAPHKLKAAAISDTFGISETYLGSYFKNQCGETIQHFIANYKIRLIEHRLKFSDRRINEIADEFGFADESHLKKFFKKHRDISLTAYRKSRAADKAAPLLLQ